MTENKKIIRRTTELPDWYSLDKYDASNCLDAAGWYEHLTLRSGYTFFLNHETFKSRKANPTEADKLRHEGIAYLRENPMSTNVDKVVEMLVGGGQLSALKHDPEYFSQVSNAISPLSFNRLYMIADCLKKPTLDRFLKYMHDLFSWDIGNPVTPSEDDIKWAHQWIFDPIRKAIAKEGEGQLFDGTIDVVEIDLSVPDKILVDQFTSYIKHVRAAYPNIKTARRFKRPEFPKWVDYAVLPYIDLEMWAEENNLSIPNRVMADAIFPDGEKGEEAVRKTTQKLAVKIMQNDYIQFVAKIASQEIMEDN
jgi:hypothetical protein